MAQIPYTSEIKSNKISNDPATRLYQFMQINKLADGLSVLNGSKQNNQDLQTLAEQIGSLYTNYMDDKLANQDEKALADKVFSDEQLMDIADKITFTDSHEQKMSLIRDYVAQKVGRTIIEDIRQSAVQGDDILRDDALNLVNTLFLILQKENSKIDSKDFANRLISGKLQPEEISVAVNALQSAKQKIIQRMKCDWQTYGDICKENKNIKKFSNYLESVLTDDKEFKYKVYAETHNVLLCIRDDFSDKDSGSKSAFLKMMGFLLDGGQKQISATSPQAAKIMKESNYNKFVDLLKAEYPENTESVLNTMFEIADNAENPEQARREAFDKKSKELYVKFLSAVLVLKKEAVEAEHQAGFNYQRYINENIASYIANLKNGQNNIAKDLHLTDESKAQSVKDIIDDTAEDQIISVHHKIPVAAAVPLYLAQHSELHPAQKTQEMFDKLAKICPQAVENRTPEDIIIIGFALNVFSEESRKDNLAQIYKIADKEKREKKLQILKNKDAIREIYQKYFPFPLLADPEAKTPEYITKDKVKEEILRIVNDPGNHAFPLSKPVHQKAEPNGNVNIAKSDNRITINVSNTSRLTNMTVTDKIDNATILMAEYDAFHLKEIVKSLTPNFRAAIEQYNPAIRNDKNNQSQHQTIVARVIFKMPETNFIQCMRKLLNTAQRGTPMQSVKSAIGWSR